MRHHPIDEVKSAQMAGLKHALPAGPGIQRKIRGKSFSYVGVSGRPVKDSATLKRIQALVIPPAWRDVWISPDSDSHIQAIGWDARGRKQYRYHAEYRKVRDLVKFDHMLEFGKLLPRIRRRVNRDLKEHGVTKTKIVAAVVKLLEATYIRVGNEEYAEENGSFGLTTMRNRHLTVLGELLTFEFRGKSGQHHLVKLRDPQLARLLKRCKDIPGSALFQYLDEEGKPQSIQSGDVNAYLRQVTGADITAKDFRTWGGTCLAVAFLLKSCADQQATKATATDAVKCVAAKLGNRPATCRKYYIHPAVMDCYLTGKLAQHSLTMASSRSLLRYERLVLSLLAPLKRLRSKAA
jgi:DNA topoisomerase-1